MLPQQQPQQEQQPGAASSGNGSSKQGSSLATVASPSASASTGSGGKRRSFRSLLRSPNWIKKANKEPAHVPPVLTPASSSLSSSTTTTTATATAPTLQATTDRGGLAEMLRRVEALFHTDRLIAAVEALEQLDARLAGDVGEEAMAVKGVMEGDEEVRRRLRMVRERGQACKALLEESHTTEGWALVSEHGSTTTYWQPEVKEEHEGGEGGDSGSGHLVRVRVEGRVDCSVMEQLAVIREADNYSRWIPLCQASRLLHREGGSDQLVWFQMPLIDVLLEAYGADCMVEDGSIMILGKSVTDVNAIDRPGVKPEVLPPPPSGLFGGWRVEMRDFKIKFQVISPRSSHVTIMFVVDPHMRSSLAMNAINYCIKHSAGLSLAALRRHAERIIAQQNKDGQHTHPLFAIMQREPYYTDFMAPRTGRYVAVHFPSEDPPPILAALGLDVPALFKCDPYKEEQEAAVMETTKVVAVASGGGLKEGKGEGDTKATAAGPSLDAAATITATIATAAAAAMAGPTELEQGEEKENKKRLLPPLAVAAVACMGAVGVGVVLVGGWLLFPQTLSVFWPAANGM